MRNVIIAVIAVLLCVLLVGCGSVNEVEKVSNMSMYEWVSPDGVSYWVYKGDGRGAMALRVNPDGTPYVGVVN